MVLAATNFPWEIDEALVRRLEKRIHIPLPDADARRRMFDLNMRTINLSDDMDVQVLADKTEGYSGADISLICRDASLMSMRRAIEGKTPEAIRAMPKVKTKENKVVTVSKYKMQEQLELPITLADFLSALAKTKPSVNPEDIKKFDEVEKKRKGEKKLLFRIFIFFSSVEQGSRISVKKLKRITVQKNSSRKSHTSEKPQLFFFNQKN